VSEPKGTAPPPSIDPRLACVEFSFKVNCPSDFDCKPERVCPEPVATPPEINYLAKDYASFRQLLLDRLAVTAPAWTERNPADVGIALVELLAYVGDHLSYAQDAIVTEGYIGTARRRASVKRHARLVDYAMHDGRNARVWVQIVAGPAADGLTLGADDATADGTRRDRTKLLTRTRALGSATVVALNTPAFEKALAETPRVFELLHDVELRTAHNEIRFYTYGAQDCCLPKGSTRAVLDGSLPHLQVGDWLVFIEKRGPETGLPQDADPAHRHVVKLTKVIPDSDAFGGPADAADSPLTASPLADSHSVTVIEWGRADALPFALCVSATVSGVPLDDVGVALGNIVLADHGMTVSDLPRPGQLPGSITSSLAPDVVPPENPALVRPLPSTEGRCESREVFRAPLRYRPRLTNGPLTHAAPYDRANPPSSAAAATGLSLEDPAELPVAALTVFDETDSTVRWTPVRDLMSSGPLDPHFSVEVESDGTSFLRFGNGTDGLAPPRGRRFLAEYPHRQRSRRQHRGRRDPAGRQS
jgi:predicted phage baseplate assembly protein